MDIWDVPIGAKCKSVSTGAIYEIVRDMRTRLPTVGNTSVRVVKCEDGTEQRFWRGIEVEPIAVTS
jgi:hypothetical protein